MVMPIDEFFEFLQFTAEDRRLLPAVREELGRCLPAILDEFYEYMWRQPDLQKILGARDNFVRLKKAQEVHWGRLFSDRLPGNYPDLARMIGETHSRIGLTPDWYVGAYTFVFNRLIGHFVARRGKGAPPMLAAVAKLITLDIQYSLAAYETSEAGKCALLKARQDAVDNVSNVAEFATHTNDAMVTLAELTRDAREVDHRSQTIAAAAEQLAASVSTIADNSESASSDAQAAEVSVRTGIETVNSAVANMERISRSVQESSQKVNALAEASEKIAEILVSVEAIAKQTNLLALNATIEAARAGEAGKGFAVVASEVKNLANQTAKATEDISQRIDILKQEMSGILTAMDSSLQAVTEGRESIVRSGEEMQNVAMQVSQVTHKMGEISHILQQQTAATQEISGGVASIAGLAAKNNELTSSVGKTIDKSNAVIAGKVNKWAEVGTSRALCEVAKVDHLIFKKRVINTMMGTEEFQVPDHHSCRLGKWYNAVKDRAILGNPSYKALVGPHERVHAKGREAVRLAKEGDMDGALAALKDLNAASYEVLGFLDSLSKSLDY